jgi:hypothetical protein
VWGRSYIRQIVSGLSEPMSHAAFKPLKAQGTAREEATAVYYAGPEPEVGPPFLCSHDYSHTNMRLLPWLIPAVAALPVLDKRAEEVPLVPKTVPGTSNTGPAASLNGNPSYYSDWNSPNGPVPEARRGQLGSSVIGPLVRATLCFERVLPHD